MNEYPFFAYLSRMRYITRWGLMRNTFTENVQEHSHMVAVLAHGLAMIRREILGLSANPEACATAALFHDASEILTGDLPTPIKYFDPQIKTAYKQVEYFSSTKLLHTLPEELQEHYAPLVYENDETVLPIVKAADKLSAHIKCLEELKAGNSEFEAAAIQTKAALEAMELPELKWFMEHCLPTFSCSLDELEQL
jgi:5'-deoxynucleotidase